MQAMRKIIGLLLVALLAGPLAANALVISVSGQGNADGQWDVSTVTGTLDEQITILGQQVWWGDEALAFAFADELFLGLGTPNYFETGPMFAYSGVNLDTDLFGACAYIGDFLDDTFCGDTRNRPWTFAVATRVTAVPEPGTLALLGF